MFTSISHKKKCIYAGILAVLLLFALYKKNFSEIFLLQNEIEKKEELKAAYANPPLRLIQLQREAALLDQSIGGTEVRPENIQKKLVQFVSDKKYEVDMVGIEKIHRAETEGFAIYTNQITIAGNYQDLIRFLYSLEKNFTGSKLVNVHFFTKKNYSTHSKKLYLTLTFQNYENQT